MKAYFAFTKKEFCEMIRTYKLLIMSIVFIIIGIMNPLTAKLTPNILSSFMPEGMSITITEPTAMDSWMQFYKNVPQMGLIVTVVVFSGIITNEYAKGTLINILTKGLSRKTVILAKFTAASVIWTLSYWICFSISFGYTKYFWWENTPNIFFSALCVWIFGVFLVAVLILAGVVFKSNYMVLLMTGLFMVALFLVNIIPKFKEYNPLTLITDNMLLLKESVEISAFMWPIIISFLFIVISIVSAIYIFDKKQL